ncbi:MAG: exodeoxyribonuclease VII large subunit [Gammaproteobacteria bacterium]|nr:exodeoxyribonuclease VII large subunit [Gammaproteobacteria bacterium]
MYELERARQVYSVSELTAAVRRLIEQGFPPILVEGEVSNFRSPGRAGHWYFSLKDGQAQIRCAMFANRNRFVRRPLRDGTLVVVRCRLSLYEARGDFQAIVDAVEPAGEGELRAAFERLKIQLEHEGLFAADRKRALPRFPRHVGIVSSLSGAALQDVLAVLRRRFPCVRATCYAATVQGVGAVPEIVAAIDRAEASKPRPDVLLLTRGGGSLEDLMAFNSAVLARRMAQSPIPIVSAVGHETDVTIADFVADQRAPTPSAAAEMLTPDRAELILHVRRRTDSLTGRALNRLQSERRVLGATRGRLIHPARSLEQRMQRADELRERLARTVARRTSAAEARLDAARRLLARANPDALIERAADRTAGARDALGVAALRKLDASGAAVAGLRRALLAVSPLATLDRGFAIISRPDGTRWGTVITDAAQACAGDAIQAHLSSGTIDATVTDGPPRPDTP